MYRKFFVGALPLAICLWAAAAEVPRYKLNVGQELTYQTTGTSWSTKDTTGPQNKQVETMTRVFWVTAVNPDSGWHIVEESRPQTGSSDRVRMASFDMLPNGEIRMDTMARMMLDPAQFIPSLPASADAMSWQSVGRDNDTTSFHLVPATEPTLFNFDATVDGVFPRLYQWDITAHYHFDTARGLLAQSDDHYDEKLYNRVEDRSTILTEDKLLTPEAIKQFAAQANATLNASRNYDQTMNADNVSDKSMDGALAAVQTVRQQVMLSDLASVLDAVIAEHPNYVKEVKEDLERQTAVVGKPAPDWEFADLRGKRHSLKELRGKVVVLDFWYRGCGWCMRAMPQVKQISADFAGKPVAVFGMNTDADPKDAQVVADYFSLPYPTLLTATPAGQISQAAVAEQYHVRGFPTLVLIGPDGTVRDFHVGYSPTLHDDVAKKIAAMLN